MDVLLTLRSEAQSFFFFLLLSFSLSPSLSLFSAVIYIVPVSFLIANVVVVVIYRRVILRRKGKPLFLNNLKLQLGIFCCQFVLLAKQDTCG